MAGRRARIETYRDLEIWQRGVDLVEQVYRLTQQFPAYERYGVTAQIRRAAVSIPSNIAEGWGRGSKTEYAHFLNIARSSLFEVETQLIVAHRLGYIAEDALHAAFAHSDSMSRMMLTLKRALRP